MTAIDSAWFEEACRVTQQPLAFIDRDDNFRWANHAFSQLVGYSVSELRGRTWMSITVSEDVGGDLMSFDDVVKGFLPSYTTAKRYQHKNGTRVPVIMTVWRHPLGELEDICGFTVQSVPNLPNLIEDMRQQAEHSVESLRQQVEPLLRIYHLLVDGLDLMRKWWAVLVMLGSGIVWLIIRLHSL